MSQALPSDQEPYREGLRAVERDVQSRRRGTVGELFDRAAKRAIDILLAGALLLLLSPVMLTIAVLIWVTTPGGALFWQVRVGHRLSKFMMLKFRTMYRDLDDSIHRVYVTAMLSGRSVAADAEHGIYKLTKDPRVTTLGRFLRKTSLDELPQLINVLRGEMSLVGPRPVLPYEAELFEPRHQIRFSVKPGITGLWQVSGRSQLTMQQALDLDVEYAVRRNLALDLTTLLRTVPAVLRSRDAC
jgi:lipopolysaccharide/colanic/teichoic acid biosynthesis glycosyltransferase